MDGIGSVLGALSFTGSVFINRLRGEIYNPDSPLSRLNPFGATVVELSEDQKTGREKGHYVTMEDFAYDYRAIHDLGLEEAVLKAYPTSDAAWVIAHAINEQAHKIRTRPLGTSSDSV